jgi:hypothetical protein
MKTYDVQEIEIRAPASRVYQLVADPSQLPRWTDAFESATVGSAVLRTPHGRVDIGLRVEANPVSGTVDWRMTFPDGSVGWAHSRVVPLAGDRCAYAFVLHAPPVPLEAVEGALEAQRVTLARELARLRRLLEST